MFYILLRKVFIIVFVVTEFTHLFNKCLHITYYVLGTSLRTKNTSINQKKRCTFLLEQIVYSMTKFWSRKQDKEAKHIV